MAKILRKSNEIHGTQFSKLKCFSRLKVDIASLLNSNVKDGSQIRLYTIDKESFSPF